MLKIGGIVARYLSRGSILVFILFLQTTSDCFGNIAQSLFEIVVNADTKKPTATVKFEAILIGEKPFEQLIADAKIFVLEAIGDRGGGEIRRLGLYDAEKFSRLLAQIEEGTVIDPIELRHFELFRERLRYLRFLVRGHLGLAESTGDLHLIIKWMGKVKDCLKKDEPEAAVEWIAKLKDSVFLDPLQFAALVKRQAVSGEPEVEFREWLNIQRSYFLKHLDKHKPKKYWHELRKFLGVLLSLQQGLAAREQWDLKNSHYRLLYWSYEALGNMHNQIIHGSPPGLCEMSIQDEKFLPNDLLRDRIRMLLSATTFSYK